MPLDTTWHGTARQHSTREGGAERSGWGAGAGSDSDEMALLLAWFPRSVAEGRGILT